MVEWTIKGCSSSSRHSRRQGYLHLLSSHPNPNTSLHLERSIDQRVLNRIRRLYTSNGPQKCVKSVSRHIHRIRVDHSRLAIPQNPRCGTILQPKLFIVPQWRDDRVCVSQTDAGTPSGFLPVAQPVDAQLRKDLIDSPNEFVHLFQGVTRCNRDPEPFLTNCNGGVIDRLDVDVVLGEKLVRRRLRQSSVTYQDRNDVRGSRTIEVWSATIGPINGSAYNIHNRDVNLCKSPLDFSNVDLFQLTVADIFFLVRHTGASTRHGSRWQGGRENETGSIRPDHIDKVIRTSDVTANSAISFA
jgi:hypothetical protein